MCFTISLIWYPVWKLAFENSSVQDSSTVNYLPLTLYNTDHYDLP